MMVGYVQVEGEAVDGPTITVTSGSSNNTFYYENGRLVYPCRCGKTHRGDYAVEDWMMHGCSHPEIWVDRDEDWPQAYCCQCGRTFLVA